jgi:hypothetical protein
VFELFVRELLVGDEEKLVPIADLLFVALKAVDAEAIQGQATLKTSSHLKLNPGEYDSLLREHTRFSDNVPSFAPEAIVYNVQPEPQSKAKELKLIIAKSIAYTDALFVDITAEYSGPIEPAELALQMNLELERIIEILGLKERVETARSAS